LRVLLGLIFVTAGLLWAWRVYRTFRRGPRETALNLAFDFVSGYAIDLILVLALVVLGVLMIAGEWLAW
jgi:hypothetical protein